MTTTQLLAEVTGSVSWYISPSTVIIVGAFLLSVVTLVDVLKSRSMKPLSKIGWALVVTAITVIGPILWFSWGRKPQDT